MQSVNAGVTTYWAPTLAAIRTDLPLYAAALIYLIGGAVFLAVSGRAFMGEYDTYALGCIILCCLVLPYIALTIAVLRIVFVARGNRLAWRAMVAPRRVARYAAGTLLMLALLMLFEAMYTSVKTSLSAGAIPHDKLVADIDRALHFGHAPSHWLAFLRTDWLLRVVETNYDGIWFPFWLTVLYWFCVSPRAERLRTRFVMTFMLTWVLVGNVIAGVALTAGPALYGYATGDHQRFASLTRFLDSTPNATSATQQYLWTLHEAGTGGLGSGISAFPSMHVAITAVCALFLAEIDKRLGIAAWIYVAVIVLSSVYLGWHYAVDGYASIILTTAIYWAVRRAPELLRLRFRWRRAAVPALAHAAKDAVAP